MSPDIPPPQSLKAPIFEQIPCYGFVSENIFINNLLTLPAIKREQKAEKRWITSKL